MERLRAQNAKLEAELKKTRTALDLSRDRASKRALQPEGRTRLKPKAPWRSITTTPAYDKHVRAELDEVALVHRCNDHIKVFREQCKQGIVGDVAGRDDQKSTRGPCQQVAVSEVSILGDHNSIANIRNFSDSGIGRAVAVRQLQRMQRIVARTAQQPREPGGQLSVDEELHAAPRGTIRRRPEARAPNSSAARRSSRSRSG